MVKVQPLSHLSVTAPLTQGSRITHRFFIPAATNPPPGCGTAFAPRRHSTAPRGRRPPGRHAKEAGVGAVNRLAQMFGARTARRGRNALDAVKRAVIVRLDLCGQKQQQPRRRARTRFVCTAHRRGGNADKGGVPAEQKIHALLVKKAAPRHFCHRAKHRPPLRRGIVADQTHAKRSLHPAHPNLLINLHDYICYYTSA